MAKRIECPECGYRIRLLNQKIKTVGVRSKRKGEKVFDYEITMPEDMTEDGRVATASNDAILVSLFSLYAGVLSAGIVSTFLPDYLPPDTVMQIVAQAGAITMGGAGSIGYGWLCAEHNQRLKRVLPWFLEQKEGWAAAKDESIGGNVKLSVDHRYRDGNTESGRTTQRFGLLPVDVEKFNQWAQGALVGKSLGINHWTPKAKMFSKPEYELLLATMQAGGIVINLGSNKGNTLTGGGRRALHHHLGASGIKAPSPADEGIFGEVLKEFAKTNGGNTPLPHPENGVCNA